MDGHGHRSFLREHPIAAFFLVTNVVTEILICACLVFLLSILTKIDGTATRTEIYSRTNQDYLYRNERDHADLKASINVLLRELERN